MYSRGCALIKPQTIIRTEMMQTKSHDGPRVVYADIVGQEGTTTKQLFDDPPAGYEFVTRRKMSNRVADSVSSHWNIRKTKQIANSIIPINLAISRIMARYQ